MSSRFGIFKFLHFAMNPIDTLNSQSTPLDHSSGRASTGGGGPLLGQMGAEQFQVESEASVLGDAAEEISLHYAEKAESKHSSERRKELLRPPPLLSPEAIEKLFEDIDDEGEGRRKLLYFVKRVLGGQGSPGQQALSMFARPSAQHLALQYALQQGEREGTSEVILSDLREALEDLQMEHGPRIRADLNTIEVATEGARGPVDIAQFQSTYEDLVLGQRTLSSSLELVLDKFGESGFDAGLERLKKALGHDMAAARPSTSVAHLQSLVQDLYHLSVASTVLDGCRSLQGELVKRHGASLGKMEAVSLMKDLVRISTEKWVSPGQFTGLAERAGATDVEPRINFLTHVKTLLRDMPPQIFIDGDQRDGVLSAVQDALDAAIDQEEE